MNLHRPPWCLDRFNGPDTECECLAQKSDTFCIGKTGERVDYIDGQKHENDHNFCVRSDAKGVTHFRLNTGDIDLITHILLTAKSASTDKFNLHWYFRRAFVIDEDQQLRILPELEGEDESSGIVN